jgi:hypothetical protein
VNEEHPRKFKFEVQYVAAELGFTLTPFCDARNVSPVVLHALFAYNSRYPLT